MQTVCPDPNVHLGLKLHLSQAALTSLQGTGPQICRKLDMLQAEGVSFTNGKLSDPKKCLLDSAGLKAALSTCGKQSSPALDMVTC